LQLKIHQLCGLTPSRFESIDFDHLLSPGNPIINPQYHLERIQLLEKKDLFGSRAPIFDDHSDSPIPSFAPLVAFLDLRFEPSSAIPKSFCSSLFWIYRIFNPESDQK
jgi:hypothetical protein